MTSPEYDLMIITPSRGRPKQLERLLRALGSTCRSYWGIAVGLDDDDPAHDEYVDLLYPPYDGQLAPVMGRVTMEVTRRQTLTQWSNRLWLANAGRASYFASLGDDHLPVTDGWDAKLIAGIGARTGGTGIAYGNDTLQGERLPTAPVMSANIPDVLGWLMLPGLSHFYVDDVWRDLGRDSGCLTYMPDVIVQHCHPIDLFTHDDQTYADARDGDQMAIDGAAYKTWCEYSRGDQVSLIARLAESS